MRTEQQILRILLDSSEPVTSKSLSFQLGISERTALKYLNILKASLIGSGAEIRVKQRLGSYISVSDPALFRLFRDKFFSNSVLEDPALRRMYVLMRLIADDDYIDLYELADELAVSPSLLRSIIRDLVPLLQKYSLKLDHSRLRGYRVKGDEVSIRSCLTKECRSFSMLNDVLMKGGFQNNEQSVIHQIIASALEQYNIAVSNAGIDSLTLHTLIAINRLETGNPIRLDNQSGCLSLRTTPDYFATCRIGDSLQEKLSITLPENELVYLTMHISGKQRLFGHEQLQVTVDDRALRFYNNFLRRIYRLSDEDFFEDEELRTSLLNHIVPFLRRVDNNMMIEKTEMNNIKSEFPYAYDLAVTGLSLFDDQNIRIPEAEISYFSLHLALSLEKRKGNTKMKYNVLLICREVSTVYQLLSFKLGKHFPDSINEIVFTSPGDPHRPPYTDFQIILSTIGPDPSFPENTVCISPFLNEEDTARVRDEINRISSRIAENVVLKRELFLTMEGGTQEEILRRMTRHIRTYIPLPDDFLERVCVRERLATTELDSRIAIPHPISNENLPGFVCIARLQKPCIWKEKPVQLIFLVSSSSDINPWLYEKISRIIGSSQLSRKLIEAADFEAFLSIFEKI